MNKRREKLKKWLEESSWEVGGDFGQHHTNSTKWIFWELIRNFKILFPRRFTLFACASETDNRINWFSFQSEFSLISFCHLQFDSQIQKMFFIDKLWLLSVQNQKIKWISKFAKDIDRNHSHIVLHKQKRELVTQFTEFWESWLSWVKVESRLIF